MKKLNPQNPVSSNGVKGKRLAKSIKKYVRSQKAQIRRRSFSETERREQVGKLYEKLGLTKR